MNWYKKAQKSEQDVLRPLYLGPLSWENENNIRQIVLSSFNDVFKEGGLGALFSEYYDTNISQIIDKNGKQKLEIDLVVPLPYNYQNYDDSLKSIFLQKLDKLSDVIKRGVNQIIGTYPFIRIKGKNSTPDSPQWEDDPKWQDPFFITYITKYIIDNPYHIESVPRKFRLIPKIKRAWIRAWVRAIKSKKYPFNNVHREVKEEVAKELRNYELV